MSDWLDIHALADGQLEGKERSDAEARLAGSKECRAEHDSILMIKSVLACKCEAHASPEAWSVCRARLQELQKKRGVEAFVGRYAWGLCGIFLAAIIGAGIMNRSGLRQELAAGDVARIASGMAQLSPTQGHMEDMRSWIKDRVMIDFGNLKPQYGESGVIKGHEVSRFLVRDGKGPFSLIVVQGEEEFEGVEPISGPGNYSAVRVEGGNGVTWHDEGFTLLVVGSRSIDEMLNVAESIRLHR